MEFPRYLLPSIEQFLEENHLSKTAERLRKEASMKPNEGQVRAPDLKEMYQLYLEHKPTVAQPEVPQREEQKKRKRKEKKSKTGEAAAQCKRVKVEAAIETDAADPEKKTEKKRKKKGKKKEKKAEGKEDKKREEEEKEESKEAADERRRCGHERRKRRRREQRRRETAGNPPTARGRNQRAENRARGFERTRRSDSQNESEDLQSPLQASPRGGSRNQ